MKYLIAIIIIFSLVAPVHAGQETNDLCFCLVGEITDDDMELIAKWSLFMAFAHPELKQFLNVSRDELQQVNIDMAATITRLYTIDCAGKTKKALYAEGSQSIITSFNFIKEIALNKIAENKEVVAAASEYAKYLDF